VRSGILTSVHAFAVDPTRGTFILVLLAIYIGGALALYGARVGRVKAGQGFDLLSREGGLVLNNLLLSVILGIVLIGTLYPIVAQGMGQQLSVGPPFFNKTTGPIALFLVAAMAAGPMLRWRRDESNALLQRMTVPIAVALLAMAATFVAAPGTGWMEIVGLGLAAGLAIASFAPLWKRNLLRTPLFTWGMVIAHFGCAVSLAGMAADSAFTAERLVAARYGQPYYVGPWRVVLNGVAPVVGDNWSAVEGRVTALRGERGTPLPLTPQRRFYASPPTDTAEASIRTRLDGQLYAVLGAQDAEGRWQLRLWWKPFVTLIWLGGGLIALGGALSLIGRVFRERRNVRRREEAA
jgi:cytochrome c-type biogenesis protein CcmF